MDDHLLYGRPIGCIKSRPHEAASISYELIRQYRPAHPGQKGLQRIERLLSHRRIEELVSDSDIIVSRCGEPWDWRYDEVEIRARWFDFVEISNCDWSPPVPLNPPHEGWLFVEARRIVGAAEFYFDPPSD
jgi:hypothetical protein